MLERDHLDDIFTWQEQRCVTAQLTVHHKRTMYVLEPSRVDDDVVRMYSDHDGRAGPGVKVR